MSAAIQTMTTPGGEFQSHFGSPPGSPDAAAECKKWESLYAELLAEREKLRAELAQSQADCDLYRKSLFHNLCKDYKPTFTEAERDDALARVNERPTVEDIIAELENAPRP